MGLPYKWEQMANDVVKQVGLRQLDAQKRGYSVESLPEAIGLEHVYGPLLFLIAGLMLATVTFTSLELTLYCNKLRVISHSLKAK